MKRALAILLALLIIGSLLSGRAKVIKEEPIDTHFEPAHEHHYFYPMRIGGITILYPGVDHIPDRYYITYKLYYDNNKVRTTQRLVTKEAYDAFLEDQETD